MTSDECIALSDAQLVDKTYDVVCQVMQVDEVAGDALATLVGELLERFAPEAARAELIRLHRDLEALSLVHAALAEDELRGDLESLRQRQAARLLRDTVDS
jgi:hypothetical protein